MSRTINERNTRKVSVRALADFNQLTGDLASSVRPSPSSFEGQQTHRLVQTNRPSFCKTEVTVEAQWLTKHYELHVTGRVDCLFDNVVEELKTSRVPPDEIPTTLQEQHHRQVIIYAAIIAMETPETANWVCRVTYVHPQTLEEWPIDSRYSRQQLIERFIEYCSRFDTWLSTIDQHRKAKTVWAKQLDFPFDSMRAAQRAMAESIYKACRMGKHLSIEAPTGTGKTLASIFPALKALPETQNESLLYLTMKTTGKLAAQQALTQIDPDRFLNTVSLGAKTRMCLQTDSPCDGEFCPYGKDYFEKRNRLMPLLLSQTLWTESELKNLGEDKKVCPYYLSQDWAPWADVVIGDINYIYDTTAVQPYLLKEIDNRATVLIDEGHNLIDRGRMIFSDTFDGERLQKLLKHVPTRIKASLKPIQTQLRTVCKTYDGEVNDKSPTALCVALRDFVAKSPNILRENPSFEPDSLWQEFIFSCARFTRLNELANDTDFIWRYRNGNTHERRVELHCLNPASLLKAKHDLVNNVVLFSATLQPWSFSQSLNGLDDQVTQALPSPFHSSQFQVYLANDISTRYTDREHLPLKLSDTLRTIINSDRNAFVFFSSYQQLQQCLKLLPKHAHALVHQTDWEATDRDMIIERFKRERNLTLLTVLGGAFAEGIDLPGLSLSMVAVVGPGLPQVNIINQSTRASLEASGLPGFDYTYVFPGLHKVLQAAGRCVRTETDEGQILLIDDRFQQYAQKRWLPPHWTIQSGPLNQWKI